MTRCCYRPNSGPALGRRHFVLTGIKPYLSLSMIFNIANIARSLITFNKNIFFSKCHVFIMYNLGIGMQGEGEAGGCWGGGG